MLMWEGFHHDGKVPILINVEYDEELELYIVEATRGTERDFKMFTPKHKPENGLMHVADLEKAIKKANTILKLLKTEALRKKK